MILAIDQGTSGTTCLVFDPEAELIGRAHREFEQHFPRPGWVEHDAAEIWEVTRAVAGPAPAGAGGRAGGAGRPGPRGAAAPRARVAGPAHRGALRRAARGGPRGPDPRAHGPGDRPL